MKFTELEPKGAFVIEPELILDERGFFARSWDAQEFAARGLESSLSQCSISFNKSKGTLRGLHYQAPPHEEAKLIRCTMGKIFDVIVDIRPSSLTFKKWVGVDLSADNHKMVYVPKGFAHGFLSLTDNCEVFYQMSQSYVAESARGIRWNDPALGIKWPMHSVISPKDTLFPDFNGDLT